MDIEMYYAVGSHSAFAFVLFCFCFVVFLVFCCFLLLVWFWFLVWFFFLFVFSSFSINCQLRCLLFFVCFFFLFFDLSVCFLSFYSIYCVLRFVDCRFCSFLVLKWLRCCVAKCSTHSQLPETAPAASFPFFLCLFCCTNTCPCAFCFFLRFSLFKLRGPSLTKRMVTCVVLYCVMFSRVCFVWVCRRRAMCVQTPSPVCPTIWG
jgi:hypothetical protein